MREYKEKRYDRGSRRPGRDSDRFGRSSQRFGRSNSSGFKRRRDEKMMHQATCDSCGKDCEVPFKPTESKPVYCNDCFKGRGKGSQTNQCNCKEELEKIHQKIEKILGLIESMKKPSKKVAEKKSKVAEKTTKKTVKKKK